jgi:phosphatidylinositol glycan class B
MCQNLCVFCSEEPGHVGEDERFMANPLSFLSTMFQGVNKSDLPSHIVLFSSLELEVHPFLNAHQYSLDKSFFHAHFTVDRELQAYVMVFTQTPIHQ